MVTTNQVTQINPDEIVGIEPSTIALAWGWKLRGLYYDGIEWEEVDFDHFNTPEVIQIDYQKKQVTHFHF
jgi:hypothetical protein